MKLIHYAWQTESRTLKIQLSWWLYHFWRLIFSGLLNLQNNNSVCPKYCKQKICLKYFNFITAPDTDLAQETLKNMNEIKFMKHIIALIFRNKMLPALTKGKMLFESTQSFYRWRDLDSDMLQDSWSLHSIVMAEPKGKKKLIITSSKMTIVFNSRWRSNRQ